MKVYIAGPYTKGDVAVNIHTAIDYASRLMEAGFVPYIPHLTHFWHLVAPRDYEDWLEYDLEWLKSCDCLLRIPGESNGADLEAEYASEHGIPVYTSLEKLFDIAKQ